MTQQFLTEQLHILEGVSEDNLGYTPLCLTAARAAAEVGDLTTCLTIVNSAFSVFSQAELPEISAPLLRVCNELAYHSTAA